MKLNWHSNAPWSSTGYANQTKLFVPRIKQLGYDISVTAFYGLSGGPIDVGGIRVYPLGKHPYGQDIIGASAEFDGASAIISLMDAWVMQPENIPETIGWYPWFPIDTAPISPLVLEKVRLARKGITMSKFGQKMAEQAGLDTFYVPHGVDTKVFKPLDRVECRKRLEWPADKFIVGMVAANKGVPPRKSFFEQIAAFAALHSAHPDTLLYLHTDDGSHAGEAVNLLKYCAALGLKTGYQKNGPVDDNIDVLFAEQYTYLLGLPDQYLVDAYNSFDVLMNVSTGEGFGIPILEAQACGCPVIVGDWTSMSELCFSGWKISKQEARQTWHPFFEAWQWMPNTEAIAERLQFAYEMRNNQDYRDNARDGTRHYDADYVAEHYWKPVLAEIEKLNDHKHEWLQVGLYNKDGSISIPCKQCGAELVQNQQGQQRIIPGGFAAVKGIEFSDPDGLEWLLMRECVSEYDGNIAPKKVIDIGAHVGVVSMYLAKKYGCEVWAYEPEPDNFRRLSENVKLNKLEKLIHVHNLAVTADGRDVMIGGATPGNSGSNTIYAANGVTAKSITLPEILKQAGAVDMLKIDCEGAEFEILADPEILQGVQVVRGEVHNAHGDGAKLIECLKTVVPDVKMVVLK